MFALITLLLVMIVSISITKVATSALTHTGVSRELARFQARSAFTGAGFTTAEAEQFVNHPVRRRILMLLMLLGNAGIVTAMASLMLTFLAEDVGVSRLARLAAIVGGAAVLWLLAASRVVDAAMDRVVAWALRRYTDIDTSDYANLLHLAGEYGVKELQVQPEDWLCDRTLGQLRLSREGVLVLGIQRADGTYLGAPVRDTCIRAKDVLILYGRDRTLCNLDERRSGARGEEEHREMAREHSEVVEEERRRDPADETDGSGAVT